MSFYFNPNISDDQKTKQHEKDKEMLRILRYSNTESSVVDLGIFRKTKQIKPPRRKKQKSA